ncbi:MAG: DUF1349 domain-containing protein [Acidobacteria bacterium]|nr:DUF1349 domain-containing protein [Acidobacteriota bacterium]
MRSTYQGTLLIILSSCALFVHSIQGAQMTKNPAQSEFLLLEESFDAPKFDARLRWLNPPPAAEIRDGWLTVTPGDKTDFWQKTVTGESHDNGHLLYIEVRGDFVAETKVTGEFQNRYDHAGLMVRQDATRWLKTSAENDPVGTPQLGVVITRETSDWSVSCPAPKEYTLRLERRGDLVEVHTTLDGREWPLLRQANLPLEDPVKVGIFAACPIKEGFRVRFDYLRIMRQRNPNPAP